MNKAQTIQLDNIVIRFSGDSGDGMQLTGNLFAQLSAELGNEISTFTDFLPKLELLKALWVEFPDFRFMLGPTKFTLRETK